MNVKKYLHGVFLFCLFLLAIFSSHKNAFAASISLSDFSTDKIYSQDDEFQVKVNLQIDAAEGTIYYLRGIFYADESHNYCGFTWNGNSWFKGPYSTDGKWKNFLKVTIASKSAETVLRAKIDSTDSGCHKEGSYKFKIQRFTESGSASFDSQNEAVVFVSIPTPTFTLVSTSTPIPKPTNTLVATKIVNSPAKVTSPTMKDARVTSVSGVSTLSVQTSPTTDVSHSTLLESSVWGIATQEGKNVGSESISIDPEYSSGNYQFPYIILIFIGGVLFIASAVVMGLKMRNEKNSG